MNDDYSELTAEQRSLIGRLLRLCLTDNLVVGLLVLFVVGWGVLVAGLNLRTPWGRRRTDRTQPAECGSSPSFARGQTDLSKEG